ncbi:MAG: nucleoside-binding protein [Kangiellaceae bacterium]|nr:nucleoside-binding protein [Kangiellaceae bacterium]|tara:strand:+ start:178 stop:963 length:786 start_codon:yes stop_codon:yes gene_type:complete
MKEILGTILLAGVCCGIHAADWSDTEVHLQWGKLDAPSFAGGETSDTFITTLQNASGWKYGTTFFFVDYLVDDHEDGFNDRDFYVEFYASLSLSHMFDREVGLGPVKDIGPVFGINVGADPNVVKYLPGIRFSWEAAGFRFLNTDIAAYIDDSEGAASGGAPRQDNSWWVDVSWSRPFQIGEQFFEFTGHMEYIAKRDNEFDQEVAAWILAQPQFRWDAGNALFKRKDQLYLGIEYQLWQNKLGDKDTDESVAQALVVWQI